MNIIAFVLAAIAIMAMLKLIRHERHQDLEIRKLRDEMTLLKEKTASNSEAETFRQKCVKCVIWGGV